MDGPTGRRAVGLCLLMVIARPVSPSARLPAQQVAPNRATEYLFPTNVEDARAIWVNPAGLAVRREASVYAEALVGDPGANGRLRQLNVGFNSSGLSFAYQRDIFDNGLRGSTYRLGLGAGAGGLAAGFAVARYGGGGTVSTGWDLGVRYVALPRAGLTVGAVAANLGQPIVRGLRQRMTFVPGFTWQPPPLPALALSADASITPDSVAFYAFGAGWRTGDVTARWPLEIIARLETDRGLRRAGFAFGVSLGSRDRGGVIATTPGNFSRIDGASLYGLSAREPSARR
jgi:hypothetical protein